MNNASDNTLITYAKDYIRNGFVVMPVINSLVDGKTEKADHKRVAEANT